MIPDLSFDQWFRVATLILWLGIAAFVYLTTRDALKKMTRALDEMRAIELKRLSVHFKVLDRKDDTK